MREYRGYIAVSILSLVGKTIEYQEADLSNQVVQDASEKSDGTVGQDGNIESNSIQQNHAGENTLDVVMQKLQSFADANNLSVEEYPTELIELLEKNPETEEFVLNYPLKKIPILR